MFTPHAHLVFVTKYRHPVFTARHRERMEEIIRDVCRDFECELAEFNGAANHVHLLVRFPPTVALSRLVNSLKGVSSRRLRQEFPDLRRHYWRANRLWSGSYFAGSAGGAPITVLRQYIEQQEPDREDNHQRRQHKTADQPGWEHVPLPSSEARASSRSASG